MTVTPHDIYMVTFLRKDDGSPHYDGRIFVVTSDIGGRNYVTAAYNYMDRQTKNFGRHLQPKNFGNTLKLERSRISDDMPLHAHQDAVDRFRADGYVFEGFYWE